VRFCEILEWIKATDLQTLVRGKEYTSATDQTDEKGAVPKTLKKKLKES